MNAKPKNRIGIIGGSGFDKFSALQHSDSVAGDAHYGSPSAALQTGRFAGTDVLFMPRHGEEHTIPPHLVNYRANLWALHAAGIDVVIALAAVGGITKHCVPGSLIIPDQILDYTYGREHTFNDSVQGPVKHFDFTRPYCEHLRQYMLDAGRQLDMALIRSGTYAAVQGPRFETAAEINKLERDGADIVGMTGMPEAALARELGMCYATVALVVNKAAGRGVNEITQVEIEKVFTETQAKVYGLLEVVIPSVEKMAYAPSLAVSG